MWLQTFLGNAPVVTQSVPLARIKYDAVVRWAGPPIASCNGELRYALRSLEKLTNLRRVFVVAAGTPPAWLNGETVTVVREDDIIIPGLRRIKATLGKSARSSELCKVGFDLIHDLLEHFVVLDDDYMILNSDPEFFTEKGLPVVPQKIFMCHRPLPMTRSLYRDQVLSLPANFYRPGKTRFQYDIFPEIYEDQFVKTVTWKDQNSHFIQKNFRPSMTFWLNKGTVKNDHCKDLLHNVLTSRPDFVCINDDWADQDLVSIPRIREYRMQLQKMYDVLFPNASIFEL
jgi:hypothetical protein